MQKDSSKLAEPMSSTRPRAHSGGHPTLLGLHTSHRRVATRYTLMELFLRINNRRDIARSEQTHLAFYGSKGQKSSVYWTFELLGLHEFGSARGKRCTSLV